MSRSNIKANDCKAIRSEIEETFLGQELDAKALSHVRECSSCLEFYESDKKLRQMMSGLVPVEAPADFHFRLRARIVREQSRPPYRFPFGNISIALPSAGLAAMILLGGGLLVFRSINTPVTNTHTVVEQTKVETKVQPAPAPPAAAEEKPALAAAPEPIKPKENLQNRKPLEVDRRQLVGSREKNKVVYQDLSSYGAASLRRDNPMADGQALTFPVQTLKVSVDDGSGVSRTISIPTVSFGSQRTLVGAGSSFQPPARSDW
jgi:hypothetical protein